MINDKLQDWSIEDLNNGISYDRIQLYTQLEGPIDFICICRVAVQTTKIPTSRINELITLRTSDVALAFLVLVFTEVFFFPSLTSELDNFIRSSTKTLFELNKIVERIYGIYNLYHDSVNSRVRKLIKEALVDEN